MAEKRKMWRNIVIGMFVLAVLLAFGNRFMPKPAEEIELKNLEQNGYTFFSGELTVSKKFTLDSTDYKLSFAKNGFNALGIKEFVEVVKHICGIVAIV